MKDQKAGDLAVGPLAFLIRILEERWKGLHLGESFEGAASDVGLTLDEVSRISSGEERNPSMQVVSKLAVLFAEDLSEGAELITEMRTMRIK
jgi:hypothetical protein